MMVHRAKEGQEMQCTPPTHTHTKIGGCGVKHAVRSCRRSAKSGTAKGCVKRTSKVYSRPLRRALELVSEAEPDCPEASKFLWRLLFFLNRSTQ